MTHIRPSSKFYRISLPLSESRTILGNTGLKTIKIDVFRGEINPTGIRIVDGSLGESIVLTAKQSSGAIRKDGKVFRDNETVENHASIVQFHMFDEP